MKIQVTGTEITPSRITTNGEQSDRTIRKTIKVGSSRSSHNTIHKIELQADELVEFQFEKGVVWISTPENVPAVFGQQGTMRSSTFIIPSKVYLDQNTRSLFSTIALEIIRIFSPKITEPVVSKAVNEIEKRLLPDEGLNWVTETFQLQPLLNQNIGQRLNLTKPVLLFLHGTISNTNGSFGGLKNSKTWGALHRKYGENILAFDHKTLSKSPFENAQELLVVLPKGIKLHLVSHSRGGLIGEILVRCAQQKAPFSAADISNLEKLNQSILTKLIETLKALPEEAAKSIFSQSGLDNFSKETFKNWDKIDLKTAAQLFVKLNQIDWRAMKLQPFFDTAREPILSELLNQLDQPNRQKDAEVLRQLNTLAATKSITVEKFVRTACPANGTSILGANIDVVLNVLLNVFLLAFGQIVNPFAQTVKSLINAIVQQRNNPRVLPGLESMIKGTPLLALLNPKDYSIKGELTVIAGKTGGHKFNKIVKHFFVNRLFQAENDLVVDTDSMFEGIPRTNEVLYKFVTGSEVNHFGYFDNLESQVAIYHALISDKKTARGYFKKYKKGSKNRGIILRPTQNQFSRNNVGKSSGKNIAITVKNGHLKYAKYPVIIGHFKNDIITSAEKVMDDLLQDELSKNLALGAYPGAVDSSPLILNNGWKQLSTIIIGLGKPEEFTPYALSQSVENAVTAYLLDLERNHPELIKKEVGLSTLLLGTNYIHISMGDALNAILEGIISANEKILSNRKHPQIPTISKVEFIEIYEDKSISAFHHLCNIANANNTINIEVEKDIVFTNVRRTFRPIGLESTWWKRLTALMQEDAKTKQKSLYFNAATQRAAVSERYSYANQRNIANLLAEHSQQTNWDPKLMKTLFNLIIPNDLKLIFRGQQNILLLLDKYTANYPWELLHYNENATKPLCVSSGMIRQLATTYDNYAKPTVSKNKVLIIGDPLLEPQSGIPQLPAAAREATLVDELFHKSNKGFSTILSLQESGQSIVKNLFGDFKVLHIASHGVVDYQSTLHPDEPERTGLLLSDDFVLTTAEIDKMDTIPELVFINSCFAGSIDFDKESYSRSRYNLAANIGTYFIEQGAKVVIVAGWAIDDDAAFRFAESFYTKMLLGRTFAEALQDAREICFKKFPYTNTWGAYQCYGDQNYRLLKPTRQKSGERTYKDQLQILADLESVINDAKSARYRNDDLKERLDEISEGITKGKFINAQIAELEAAAYAEILDFPNAIDKYKALWGQPNALFSIKSVEQQLNLEARYIASTPEIFSQTEAIKKVDVIIKELKSFLKRGKTVERYNLVASAYRRKAIILTAPAASLKAIEQSAINYRNAFKKSGKKNGYALINWLIAERFLMPEEAVDLENIATSIHKDHKSIKRLSNYIKTSIPTFLEERLAESTSIEIDEFWDLITTVNIYQCQLIYAPTNQFASISKKIEEFYKKAWDLDGSFRQKASEIDQMRFIQDAVKTIKPNQNKLLTTLEDLIGFFKTLS